MNEKKVYKRKIDLVFRSIGERTSNIALELAIKNINPNKIHVIENVKPFSKAMEKILKIEYDCDFVVFMDADCLILEDLRPFLENNEYAYIDCFVFDKFRGNVHLGVHITRIDVIKEMQQVLIEENDLKYILRPESRIRNIALQNLKELKIFKKFRILHDFFQDYEDIFVKYAVRELRSRTDHLKMKLERCMQSWKLSDSDYFVAKHAVKYTRENVPNDCSPEEVANYIKILPEIAYEEIQKLSLKKKKPLEIQEVQGLKAALNAINQFNLPNEKIYCIGLSRTCTKSLTMALDILGLNVIHYPDDPLTFEELSSGNYNLSLLNDYDGIADITVSPYYAQLDKLYPNSKFILTIREKESWLRSLRKHWEDRPPFRDKNETSIHMKVRRFLRAAVYGTYTFNRERMSYVYDLHNKNVLDYFKDKPNSLLILDIYGGEGWSKLCKFLNATQIEGTFPDVKNSLELFEVL